MLHPAFTDVCAPARQSTSRRAVTIFADTRT
jgi:hypothetical protein